MTGTIPLIYLALEGIAILGALHALFSVRTAQGTIAWIVGLVAFPILGLPLYWFFGSRRFESHSLAMRQKLEKHRCEVHRVLDEIKPFQVGRTSIFPAQASEVAAMFERDFAASEKVDARDYDRRPLVFKAGARADSLTTRARNPASRFNPVALQRVAIADRAFAFATTRRAQAGFFRDDIAFAALPLRPVKRGSGRRSPRHGGGMQRCMSRVGSSSCCAALF